MEFDANKKLTATGDWSRANQCPWCHWPRQQPVMNDKHTDNFTFLIDISSVPSLYKPAIIISAMPVHPCLHSIHVPNSGNKV